MPTQRITIDIETDEDPSSVLDAAQEIAHELASRIDGAADDDNVSVEDLESVQAKRADHRRTADQAEAMAAQIQQAQSWYGIGEDEWEDITTRVYATPE